jgi:hypothetical protein
MSTAETGRLTSRCPICTFENDPSLSYCEVCGIIPPPINCHQLDPAVAEQSAADELVALTMHLAFEEEQKFVPPAEFAANYVKCPHCAAPIEIVVLACTIFICGTTAAGQVNQHNEAAAQAGAATSGVSVDFRGCGRQFQVINGLPVACTGK